jgi:tripartite-type tricarboxylate transporter receptor subunit TctC
MIPRRWNALLAASAIFFSAEALAEAYPSRPIRLVVSSAPGGAADLIARPVAAQLERQMGVSIVVDNRAGANGIIGTDIVAKAVPDGYTFLVNTVAITINPSVYRKLPFDTQKDIQPVTNLALGSGYVLVVNPSFAARSVQELIALTRNSDYRVGYGTPGLGNGQHLAGELFNLRAGTHLLHVPYKGVAPAMTAILGGEVQMGFIPPIVVMQHIKAGKVRALGFTGTARLPALPDVPTIAEAGVPGFRFVGNWDGWFAPAKTPGAIIARIYAELRQALQVPKIRESIIAAGYDPVADTPAEFRTFVDAEIRKYAEIVRAAKIEAQ